MTLNDVLETGISRVPIKFVQFTRPFHKPGMANRAVTQLRTDAPKDIITSDERDPVDLHFYPESGTVEVIYRQQTKLVSVGGWTDIELDIQRTQALLALRPKAKRKESVHGEREALKED